MEQNHEQVRVVFRRGSTRMKLALLCTLVLCIALLATLGALTARALDMRSQLVGQAGALEQQNANLEDKIDALDTVQGIEAVAREELGLVDPDTIIFDPES